MVVYRANKCYPRREGGEEFSKLSKQGVKAVPMRQRGFRKAKMGERNICRQTFPNVTELKIDMMYLKHQ